MHTLFGEVENELRGITPDYDFVPVCDVLIVVVADTSTPRGSEGKAGATSPMGSGSWPMLPARIAVLMLAMSLLFRDGLDLGQLLFRGQGCVNDGQELAFGFGVSLHSVH